ncbi:colicin transporter [Escherichia coli]|nr:colicin transporter [Escherichia coli]RAY04010.1 colicin transporter [Escherichia coli]
MHTFCFSALMSAICYFVGGNYYSISDEIKRRLHDNNGYK